MNGQDTKVHVISYTLPITRGASRNVKAIIGNTTPSTST